MKLKDLAKKINEQNELFNNATKSEKRVMVAQDCIDRIKMKQLQGYKGKMLGFDNSDRFEGSDESVKEVLNTCSEFKCKACAKGGLLLSYIGRVNKEKFEDIKGNVDLEHGDMRKLMKIFTAKQLSLIETAFESSEFFWNIPLTGNELDKAFEFYRKSGDSNDRLLAICQNIVENKGTFKP